MKSDCKTACILIDENDLRDFKNSYQYAIPDESLWVSLDSFSTMQAVFQEFNKSYYIPKIIEDGDLQNIWQRDPHLNWNILTRQKGNERCDHTS